MRSCGYGHSPTGVARRREVAQDQVTVILGFGPTLRVSGPTARALELHSFVAPLYDSYAITEERDGLRGIQIDLTPLGAHMLFGDAMHALCTELVIPLADVLGEWARLDACGAVLEQLTQCVNGGAGNRQDEPRDERKRCALPTRHFGCD